MPIVNKPTDKSAASVNKKEVKIDGGDKDKAKIVPPSKSKAKRLAKAKSKKAFEQASESKGLLVTEEFEAASAKCATKVKNVAKACRARNQKYRDPDFDLENDRKLCLFGAGFPDDPSEQYSPADVMRVTDIWDSPKFWDNGASSSDIEQGALGDCYFLAALANIASVPGLLERICVARDEQVGVYGFLFWRDDKWVDVIIDDFLFVSIPKFESADPMNRHYYHNDPDLFFSTARKGNKILYFAKCSVEGETWVPLIEKAYAKLHGNYVYLEGGFSGEAIEDLTGGVSSELSICDILDRNVFWEQLSKGGDHVFQCAMDNVDEENSGGAASKVLGLHSSHAYTVLRAAEYKGKRFVVVRNPWGNDEWKGRWADGSKEWTSEWLPALEALGHSFGNDGQFVMEYSDFLRYWTSIDTTKLFDSTWAVSSIWVQVDGVSPLHPRGWGDVSFTISIPEDTPAVIVLQRADNRYFRELSGYIAYSFDYIVFKKDTKEEYIPLSHVDYSHRGRGVEVNLEAGDYVVHVRMDSVQTKPVDYISESWDARALKRIYAQKARSYSKALNFVKEQWEGVIPMPLKPLAGRNITDYEIEIVGEKREAAARKRSLLTPKQEVTEDEAMGEGNGAEEEDENKEVTEEPEQEPAKDEDGSTPAVHQVPCTLCHAPQIIGVRYLCISDECTNVNLCQQCWDKHEHPEDHDMLRFVVPRKAVHEGVFCNICSTGFITGTRYKCQECEDFDICQECMDAKKTIADHTLTHALLVIPFPEVAEEVEEEAEAQPVHEGVGCNGCGMNPIVGCRYKCMDPSCPDYDLCADCVAKGIHPSSHKLLSIMEPDEAAHLRPVAGDDADIILGLRVYTSKKAVAVLGAQLKHGTLSASADK